MNSEDFLLTPGDFPITDEKVKKKKWQFLGVKQMLKFNSPFKKLKIDQFCF